MEFENTPNRSEPRTFYTWKCMVIQDNQRPLGRAQSPGCGKWQVKASKYDDPSKAPHGLMAGCVLGCLGNGGKGRRKTRLTASTRKFYTRGTREEAQALADALNEQVGGEEE